MRGGGGGVRTAGLPKLLLVMAWKSVDLPTFASPTYGRPRRHVSRIGESKAGRAGNPQCRS